jgi:acyl-CoA thioester hydrolase
MKTFSIEYRVIYGDSDPFDVVYYANYYNFFERGRTELFRELGITYREVQEQGVFLPVSESYCKYHKPARYDDLLVIETRIAFLKRVSIKFEYRIYEKLSHALLAEGYTIHAFVNRQGKILRAPREILERVTDVIKLTKNGI